MALLTRKKCLFLFTNYLCEMDVFVKPDEQRRACSYIVMARIGNRQHGALGEVERQNALFKERKRWLLFWPKAKLRLRVKVGVVMLPVLTLNRCAACPSVAWL